MTKPGKGGKPATPTSLKVLQGTNSRYINSAEPKPADGTIRAPSWLSTPGRRMWRQYAPDLIRTGVLTAWDAEAFACWCDAAVRRREAAAAVAAEGGVVDLPVFNKNGEHTGNRRGKNPWLQVLNDADTQMQRYGARFGLTPSDRAGLSVGKGSRDSGEDLLSS